MQNVNIYAVLAKWKENKKGECPIHVSIDIDGKRAAFPSVKKRIKPEYWDEKNRQLKPSAPNSVFTNAYIRQSIAKYEAEITKKQLAGGAITSDGVKKQVKKKQETTSFIEFCREQIKLSNVELSTIKSWNGSLTHLETYSPGTAFGDIDYKYLQRYEVYLKRKGLSDNTIWKQFKFLRRMLLLAIKLGLLDKNPLDDYGNKKYEQGIPDYLEWHEVLEAHETIKTDAALTDHLRLVGYYFLLSCYSGLRYSDAIRFTYDKFVIKGSNGLRLLLYAKKNNEPVSMPFTPQIREVVEYIKDKPLDLSNQKFNDALKLLGSAAKISKPLKSHMARHSFAMRCAELGMSEETVQHLLGHKDRKSTRIYFRIKNNRVDAEMAKWG